MIEMLPPPIATETPKSKDGVRELTADEIKTVEYLFTEKGHPLPNPNESTFVGYIREGKVIGFIVLQIKLHAEPMWIENGHSDIFSALVREAERTVLRRCGPAWVYTFAPAGKVSQLAQAAGMQLEPWNVFSVLVMPETPSKTSPFLVPLEEMETEGAPV